MLSNVTENSSDIRRSKTKFFEFKFKFDSFAKINLVHDHQREQWALPEEFIDVISTVTFAEFRVRSRIFILEFDETLEDFQTKFHRVIKVIEFVQTNHSIKNLARSLLSIGDFLNYVKQKGEVLFVSTTFLLV